MPQAARGGQVRVQHASCHTPDTTHPWWHVTGTSPDPSSSAPMRPQRSTLRGSLRRARCERTGIWQKQTKNHGAQPTHTAPTHPKRPVTTRSAYRPGSPLSAAALSPDPRIHSTTRNNQRPQRLGSRQAPRSGQPRSTGGQRSQRALSVADPDEFGLGPFEHRCRRGYCPIEPNREHTPGEPTGCL
jgi:hypothetical protein